MIFGQLRHDVYLRRRTGWPLVQILTCLLFCGDPSSGTWASYQIRKIAGCACTGNAGNVSPATNFKGNRLLAIPACITARLWRTCRDACRDSLPAVTGKTFPAFPAHAYPQFCVSDKRPMEAVLWMRPHKSIFTIHSREMCMFSAMQGLMLSLLLAWTSFRTNHWVRGYNIWDALTLMWLHWNESSLNDYLLSQLKPV